jgi:hypothetical protein
MRRLFAVVVALVLALGVAPSARADSFVDFVGGLQAPLGDDNWTNDVDTSPKLAVRAGVLNGQLGGMLAVDWTPENLHNGGSFFGASAAAHRFRIIAQAVLQQRVAPKVSVVGRAGAGLDIAHASYEFTLLGTTTSHSDTNLGVGFEFGAGVWLDIAQNMQLGGELAVPIGYHSHKSTNGDIAFDYTSYDLDLLFGVRLWSR